MSHSSIIPHPDNNDALFSVIASGMLRWVGVYTAGDWDLTSIGLTSIPCGTSCAQDLRLLMLHTFAFSRFPNMLFSPLFFDAR